MQHESVDNAAAISKFAAADDIAQPYLAGIMDKRGFEAYQSIRDFLVEILFALEKAKPFLTDKKHFRVIGDFRLFDQAYIDNMTLCLSIKIKAPEIYSEMLKIIDKHVKPIREEDEGLRFFYQECGGFLALLLNHYEDISVRQSLHLAVHLTGFSESTLEKSYRGRMVSLINQFSDTFPPPLALAALYGTLYSKKNDPDILNPFKEEQIRSEAEIKKTISAYWKFTERVVRHYQEKVLQYLQKNPVKIISAVAKEYGIAFPLSEQDMKKANHLSALFVMSVASAVEIMPELIEKLDNDAKLIT
jgi:hypothetical protein